MELNTINGHEYVDLGLPSGTLWATMNIGANSPELCGDYFAFGETTSKGCYDLNTYKWYDSNYQLIKYCSHSDYGKVDNKLSLEKEDDAAYVNWGGSWRIPSEADLRELIEVCTINKTEYVFNDFGYNETLYNIEFIGPNGNKLYFPATNYKLYDNVYPENIYCRSSEIGLINDLYSFNNNYASFLLYDKYENICMIACDKVREFGIPVRAVSSKLYTLTLDNNKTPKGISTIENVIETTISNFFFVTEKEYVASYNTQPDGSGVSYNINDTITLTEDITLYAQWKDKPILSIITEEGKTLIVYCEPGESVKLEKAYLDKYHNCIGFTTQKDSIEVEYEINDSITVNEDVILYVIWEDLTNGVEFIDLKLPSGNLWAKNNIEGHYAWGEIETKSAYNTNNYKYSISSWTDLTKYNCSSNYCKDGGKVDYEKSLELSDDVVSIQLKGNWHIPTKEDWEELLTLCDWEYTDKGMKVTYKNSTEYLFLPACGDRIGNYNYNTKSGFYWTKDLNSKLSAEAFALLFKNNDFHEIISESRFSGLSVRPVMKLINNIPEQPEKPETPDFPEEIPETGEILNQTIGTYNVRYWNGENDSNNQGEIAWPNRRDKVFEFLMNGGIWGVQEITSSMYPDFINKESYAYIGYGRGNGLSNEKATGEQIGIFYNALKYQILNQGSFFYKNTRSTFNRLCVWAKVQNLINGKKFFIFNNHLAHDSEEARLNQLNTLLSKIQEIAGEEKVFILGDFNFTSDSEEYQVITDIYEDSVHAQEVEGPENTYTGLYSTTDTTEKRVDYIYSNFNEIIKYKVNNDNKGLEKYPSDHYPVTIQIEF